MRRGISRRRTGRGKFGNRITHLHGINFHSKAEARRYLQLRKLEDNGTIEDLVLQPKYKLAVNGTHVCTYIADFTFRAKGVDAQIVEDVKGIETPVFRLKAKLFRILYPELAFYLVKNGKVMRYRDS